MKGKPTYEQKEKFIEEAEELAMAFTVSYPWAGKHHLLAEVIGAHISHDHVARSLVNACDHLQALMHEGGGRTQGARNQGLS